MRNHIKETSKSALLALYEDNSPVTGDFPAHKGPVTRKKASIRWSHRVTALGNDRGRKRWSWCTVWKLDCVSVHRRWRLITAPIEIFSYLTVMQISAMKRWRRLHLMCMSISTGIQSSAILSIYAASVSGNCFEMDLCRVYLGNVEWS